MLRLSLALAVCMALSWAPAFALKGPTGVVPVLTATTLSPGTASIADRMFADKDLPPIEVDVQLDFDLSFTPPKPTTKIPKKAPKKVPKKVVKKVVKKAPKKTAKKVTPKTAPAVSKKPQPKPQPKPKPMIPPPPPPQPKVVQVKKVAPLPPKKLKSKPTKSMAAHFGDVKRQLGSAKDRIGEHKYAKVVWANLLFVWTPLLLIWVANQVMGKEFLIDILVRILPEAVPASFIEMAIEDGLWVGIFGVCVVATVGTVLVEGTSLAMDIVKGSPKKTMNVKL